MTENEQLFVVSVWDLVNDCLAKSFFGVTKKRAGEIASYYRTEAFLDVRIERCEDE